MFLLLVQPVTFTVSKPRFVRLTFDHWTDQLMGRFAAASWLCEGAYRALGQLIIGASRKWDTDAVRPFPKPNF